VSPWETFFKEARGDIPIAIAERVDESSTVQVPSQGEVTAVSESQTESPSRPLGKGCFYLEGLVGSVLALAVALLVFSLELTGALVYVLAVAFNNIASMQGMPTLLKAIFLLVVHTFMVVDSICLLCSVMVSYWNCEKFASLLFERKRSCLLTVLLSCHFRSQKYSVLSRPWSC